MKNLVFCDQPQNKPPYVGAGGRKGVKGNPPYQLTRLHLPVQGKNVRRVIAGLN